MKKNLNFIVFITTFLVVLLLSITVCTETGLSNTPSPSSASPIQSKSSESSSIQLKDLIAPIITLVGIAATYLNGFNPRTTLKLDLELREKLLATPNALTNIEKDYIEQKIQHHYNNLYEKKWERQLIYGLAYLLGAFLIFYATPNYFLHPNLHLNLMNISFLEIIIYISFAGFLISGLRLLFKVFRLYR